MKIGKNFSWQVLYDCWSGVVPRGGFCTEKKIVKSIGPSPSNEKWFSSVDESIKCRQVKRETGTLSSLLSYNYLHVIWILFSGIRWMIKSVQYSQLFRIVTYEFFLWSTDDFFRQTFQGVQKSIWRAFENLRLLRKHSRLNRS